MNDVLTDNRVPMPGDRVLVRASFTRLFPWDAEPEEFLDELEADVLGGLEETGYTASLEDRDVVLVDEGIVNETYHGTVTFKLEAVPATADGEPVTHHAGIPLLAVLGGILFALGGALGFFVSYSVLDVEVLDAVAGALDELEDAAVETRKLVATAAAAAAVLFILFKYSP